MKSHFGPKRVGTTNSKLPRPERFLECRVTEEGATRVASGHGFNRAYEGTQTDHGFSR
jgi:hypothetical protein